MPMYNLLEYTKSYSKTTGSLWDYYRDEPSSRAEGNKNYAIKNLLIMKQGLQED